MKIAQILAEGLQTPVIAVDIQPHYSGIMDGDESPVFQEAIQFMNKQRGQILLLMNGEELTHDNEAGVKEYWEDCGFDPAGWARVQVVDKGYGYLRAWMDQNISRGTIIKVIRALYQAKENDTRNLPEGSVQQLTGNEYQDWMEDDGLIVEWLSIGLLKKFNNCYLVGGAEDECLAEVRLLMDAFNIKYTMIRNFIY